MHNIMIFRALPGLFHPAGWIPGFPDIEKGILSHKPEMDI